MSGAGIPTHNLLNTSLLPQPLDHATRTKVAILGYFCKKIFVKNILKKQPNLFTLIKYDSMRHEHNEDVIFKHNSRLERP